MTIGQTISNSGTLFYRYMTTLTQPFFASLQRATAAILLRHQIDSERRQLAKLDTPELLDIGIDRSSALQESQRSFNDIPNSRRADKNNTPVC